MLAIGRALMGNPRLLLMDEPLEGLAPVIVEMLLAAMRRLRAESRSAFSSSSSTRAARSTSPRAPSSSIAAR